MVQPILKHVTSKFRVQKQRNLEFFKTKYKNGFKTFR